MKSADGVLERQHDGREGAPAARHARDRVDPAPDRRDGALARGGDAAASATSRSAAPRRARRRRPARPERRSAAGEASGTMASRAAATSAARSVRMRSSSPPLRSRRPRRVPLPHLATCSVRSSERALLSRSPSCSPPPRPSAAPAPGLDYDEIVRIVVNATPPPPGNFQADLAALSASPAPVAQATPAPRKRGLGGLGAIAGAVLSGGGAGAVAGAVAGDAVASARWRTPSSSRWGRSSARSAGVMRGVPPAAPDPLRLLERLGAGRGRGAQTATIRKCDLGQVIHLDLAHKTYSVYTPSSEPTDAPRRRRAGPAPRAPGARPSPSQPGHGERQPDARPPGRWARQRIENQADRRLRHDDDLRDEQRDRELPQRQRLGRDGAVPRGALAAGGHRLPDADPAPGRARDRRPGSSRRPAAAAGRPSRPSAAARPRPPTGSRSTASSRSPAAPARPRRPAPSGTRAGSRFLTERGNLRTPGAGRRRAVRDPRRGSPSRPEATSGVPQSGRGRYHRRSLDEGWASRNGNP